jgi:hypothetical protein
MSFTSLKTLKDLEKQVAPAQKSSGAKKFFSLQPGDSFMISFLLELTEDSTNFKDEVGTAITVPVIVSPVNWKWKVASTASFEKFNYRCWGTEQSIQDKAWKPKAHLLVNVAVEVEPGKWEARVLDTTFNQRHVGLTLLEYAKEFNTVTDRYYKYSRTGSGASDTNYSLIPLAVAEPIDEIKSLTLHDLNSVYMTLPYEKQQIFLTTGELGKDTW